MLVKEYRILLPLTVDEYRIAQLYMIQKKSSTESTGTDSGVEILTNEPYENGPGGSGQYTYKVYHVGSHLPSWFRAILPKSALRVEEEAWNAYPYTKTRYTCPFVERFLLEIETVYHNDSGTQENVFGMGDQELRERIVDVMDIVKDPISDADYCIEEDPEVFVSSKTGRGPLDDRWVEKWRKSSPNEKNSPPMMCAYKVCRVEFRYWGMQTKIEKFIHDQALRRTMLRAHRQAWAWQDEWFGLTIDDIRVLEKKAQELLNQKMAALQCDGSPVTVENLDLTDTGNVQCKEQSSQHIISISSSQRSIKTLTASFEGCKQLDHLSAIRSDSSDDEFFDAAETVSDYSFNENDTVTKQNANMARCNSVELVTGDEDTTHDQLPQSNTVLENLAQPPSDSPIDLLIFVFHGGTVIDSASSVADQLTETSKNNDFTTFKNTFETVIKSHYQVLMGRVAFRMVSCPSLCSEAVKFFMSLCPQNERSTESTVCCPNMPLSIIPVYATYSVNYADRLATVMDHLNELYNDFLVCEEGANFKGQVCLIGDPMGGIFMYDTLLRLQRQSSMSREVTVSRTHSQSSSHSYAHMTIKEDEVYTAPVDRQVSAPDFNTVNSSSGYCRSQSSGVSTSTESLRQLPFKVAQAFFLGTPLSLVIALRKATDNAHFESFKPDCDQVYNVFHRVDPCCSRLEPLFSSLLADLPIFDIARFQRYPLGDGQSCLFEDWLKDLTCSSGKDTVEKSTAMLKQNWWGLKRLDYALYSPEGLGNFPTAALPAILHGSFWESSDLCAFIARQTCAFADELHGTVNVRCQDLPFVPPNPTERWRRRATSFKIKNSAANHRGNDVIVLEGQPQIISARFMYGMLDVTSLSGENVSVYIMESGDLTGDWVYHGAGITDSSGRVSFEVEEKRRLSVGIYAVKMVVGGDHTYLDMRLAIVPAGLQCVVFSIDGSFTASVSVSGKDPKVRPGAVDIVRFWQELGYMIVYVTARPCMQQQRVTGWLAQHNFPRGMLFFTDGFALSTDPLRQKTVHLRRLVNECRVLLHAAYGSTKDVHVYKEVGMEHQRIFVVGRASKKWHSQANVLIDGYSAHLAQLANGTASLAVPASSVGRLFTRRTTFALPPVQRMRGKAATISSTSVQRTRSLTQKPRGSSPCRSLVVPVAGEASTSGGVTSKRFAFYRHNRRSVSPFKFLGLARKES